MNFIKDITPVILAGGLGTRLRSSVPSLPKVLAPVCGRPFIFYILDQLSNAGFNKIIICTGYKGHLVKDITESYSELSIIYSHEMIPYGTAGAVRLALNMVETKHLLVMNGDSYVDTNLTLFCNWHFTNNYSASLILVNVRNADRFGSAKLGENDNVVEFLEKKSVINGGLINSGIYIFKKSLLKSIPLGTNSSIELDLIPLLIGNCLNGYCCNDRFIDIGTPSSFDEAQIFFKNLS